MRTGPVLVAVAVALAVVSGAAGVATAGDAEPEPPDGERLGADSVVVTVDVYENGTAAWSIQYRYRLDTENRTSGFERLRERVETREDAYAAEVAADVGQTVHVAENQTGREMAVDDVGVAATRQPIPQDHGVVVHQFTWHGFAETDGSTISLGDAIRGFWLPPHTELRLHWPAEYEAERLDPEPDQADADSATWAEPNFGVDEPAVVLRSTAGPGWPEHLAIGFALATALGTVVAIRHRDALTDAVGRFACNRQQPLAPSRGGRSARESGSRQRSSSEAPAGDGTVRPAGASDATAASARPQRTAGAAPLDGGSDGAAVDGDRIAVSDEDVAAPLSNEEQLRRVLDRHGGRLKQQTVADVCDWSDSKTSRVVRSLEDEGEIEVFRIGRENVVTTTEVTLEDD